MKEKVTSERLRGMAPGETRGFHVSRGADVDSARSLACRIGRNLGCKFSVAIASVDCITVTRHGS